MATRKSLEAKVTAAQKKLREAEETLTAHIRRNVMAVCGWSPPYGKGCGKKTSIGKLTYFQTHWYDDEPYREGSPREGEGQTQCPKCGQKLRFLDGTGNEHLEKYKYLFGKIVDVDPK